MNAAPKLNDAVALFRQGQWAAADAVCAALLKMAPRDFDALHLSGLIAYQQKDFTRAAALIDAAVAENAGSALAFNNLGLALRAGQQTARALECFGRAVALKPDFTEAWASRAAILDDIMAGDEALASFDRVVALDPGAVSAWHNRGVILADLGRGSEAAASFEHAIALAPDSAEAHWNLSLCYLQMGQFEKGWALHGWQQKTTALGLEARDFSQPQWQGDALAGKTILLHADHGFGDAVQFVRYATEVARLGARVIVEVRKPLAGLVATIVGVDEVVVRGAAVPAFDVHAPLSSLPAIFKMTADNVPGAAGYLRASDEKAAAWRGLLGEKTKPRVGLAWSGNPEHKNNQNRSIALRETLGLLSPGIEFLNLQKQLVAGDAAILAGRPDIRDFSGQLDDFSDTAVLVSLLDLVITVDTSIANVAGALGIPVWILLPANSDWRWMLGRNDTPWYASAKLYRQDRRGDWSATLARVKDDLQKL